MIYEQNVAQFRAILEEQQDESKNIEVLHEYVTVYESPLQREKIEETDSQSCESPNQEVIFAEVEYSSDENENENMKYEDNDRFASEEVSKCDIIKNGRFTSEEVSHITGNVLTHGEESHNSDIENVSKSDIIENDLLTPEEISNSEVIENDIIINEDIKHEVFVESVDAEDSSPTIFPYMTNTKQVQINANIEIEDGYILQEINKYDCKTCGDTFLYPSGIISHMSKKHNLQEIDCEDYAVKIFRKVKKATPAPRDSLLYLPDIPTAPIIHKCLICKKIFDDVATLKEHQVIHKVFVCEVCGRGFLKKSYLQDHREAHGTEKAYTCKFCGKSFKRRTVLVKHKRIHTHPRQCICEHCGKRFNDNGTLKTHKLLLHTKERNFKCMICGQTFPLKPTLDKHIRRHLKRERGEKDFPCDKCDMKYRDKSSLNRHQLAKHSGIDFKVKCQDCGKQYTTSTNLFKHRRMHHKDKEIISLEVEWTEEKQ